MISIIKLDDPIRSLRGITVEKDGDKIQRISLIASVTGWRKKTMKYNFDRNSIEDLPVYWVMIEWTCPFGIKLKYGEEAKSLL